MTRRERRLPTPVLARAGHRLHVTVPLEVEGVHAEPYRAPHLLLGRGVRREALDGLDLTIAVPLVLLGVQLVRPGRVGGEAVVADELLEDRRRDALRPAVLRLGEGHDGDALDRAPPLAPADDHLDRR